ncbi:MAG TPA: hypothetical protein VGT98_11425 [Candidatus Elarobacter sp.]|nr:hypothetical protein [Candidatus Elarobacter sp.]
MSDERPPLHSTTRVTPVLHTASTTQRTQASFNDAGAVPTRFGSETVAVIRPAP